MNRTLPSIVLLLCAVAHAQVGVKATASTKITAGYTFGGVAAVAKGTDITAGLNLATTPNIYGGARVRLTNAHNPATGGSFTFQQNGRVAPWKGSAWTGESSTRAHSVQIVYTAPRPTRVRLTLAYTGGAQTANATFGSSVTVSGLGSVKPGTYDVTIQSGGLAVTCTGRGYATSKGSLESFDATWTITLKMRSCSVSSYGTGCGASLKAIAGTSPVMRFSLSDSSRPARGFLGLGVRRIALPIPGWGGCSLYVDPLVVLDVSMSPAGVGVIDVPLPPIPDLKFYAQGVTGGSAVHTSNGLLVACR